MTTLSRWSRCAGDIMAGITNFADGNIVVGEPVECPSAAMQGDANLTAHDALERGYERHCQRVRTLVRSCSP
jgi:hypothetical protein